jgi:hypothetical protein
MSTLSITLGGVIKRHILIIVIYSNMHTRFINALCGQKVGFLLLNQVVLSRVQEPEVTPLRHTNPSLRTIAARIVAFLVRVPKRNFLTQIAISHGRNVIIWGCTHERPKNAPPKEIQIISFIETK